MLWMKTPGQRPARSLRVLPWALCALAAVFVTFAGWIRFRFGPVTFEQIVTNLPLAGGEGVGDNTLLGEAVACLVAPVVLTTSGAGALWLLRQRRQRRPATGRRTLVVPVLAMAVALGVLLTVAGVPQFAVAMLDSRTVADYYAQPTVASAPAHPRNLITIYLESTENTFADESVFGENLLENLQDATAGWADYPLRQYPTGGWTMAGIVGTQCGIPLKSKLLVAGINSNTLGEQMERYLPGATCLGDVLAGQGYTNAFVGGAHTRFAGKDTFLTDHGYTSVQGLSDWEADGEDHENISVWGLSDARLFARAKAELTDLREAGKPFSLTILTMDTHEPAGVFSSCTTADEVPMATALKCSGRAVAGFLEHLKDAGYLDDTVVVLMGDHLKNTADGGDYGPILANLTDRTIFFRAWSPDGVRFGRDGADQLSVLPTILDLLGFTLPDGRAGLGVSFASNHDLSATALALPSDEYQTLMEAPSSAIYQEFWQS